MKKPIILMVLLPFAILLNAQDGDMEVGFVQTVLEKNAINFAVNYAKKLEPNLELFKANNRSLLSFTPDIEILLGSNDAFNGVTAKYVGNIMLFDTTTVSGVTGIPDLSKGFHNFPIAIALESNQSFSFLNAILEAGYVPWYQNNKKISPLLRKTKIGAFIQAGYKYSINDSTEFTGGAGDESSELPDDNILRIKGVLGFSPTIYYDSKDEFGIALIGNGALWYDFLNSETYYKLEGRLRLMIKKDYYFDFAFEKGSGAPNFNQGEQFTANLGIRF